MDFATGMASHASPLSELPEQNPDTTTASKSVAKATGSRRRDKPQLSCDQCRRRK
ncbi:hypothetical protein BJX70DRAFT_382099 [Aspergillus crustosus]